MFRALSVRDVRGPLLKLCRWLLKWGQIPLPVLLGLSLGKLMVSPVGDLIVSLTGVTVYFIAIVANQLSGLLLWIVTYPFTRGVVNISLGSFIPDLSPTRFCIAFLTVMLLAQAAAGRRRFPRMRAAEIVALLFVAGMVRSAPDALDPIRALQVIFDALLVPVLTYFLTKNLILERRDLDRLFNAFLIVGAYTAAFGIYEQLTGNILFIGVQSQWVDARHSEHIRILRSLYGDDNAFGLIIGVTLPIAFHRFIKAPSLGKKILYAALIVLMLGGEFATFKRAAWLSLIVSMLVIQFFYPEFRRILIALLILFSIAWFLAGDQIAGGEVADRATNNLDTANGRTELWASAIELWKQKPITGHGYRRYEGLTGTVGTVESYYLHILVSAGLVGFLPFITFILLIIKDSIAIFLQIPRNPRLFVSRKVIVIFWGMLTVYLLIAGGNYMAIPVNHIVPYILMGAIVGSQNDLLVRKRRARAVSLGQATLVHH